MSTIEQRVEHLETTITSLHTIPEAIKDLGTRLQAQNDTVLKILQVHSKTLEVLADDVAVVKGDVAWIRKKLS